MLKKRSDVNFEQVLDLLKSPMDRCDSKLMGDNFMHLTMGAIGLNIANTKRDLEKLHGCTLNRIQNQDNNNLEQTVTKSIDQLITLNAIKTDDTGEYSLTVVANAALIGELF